MSFIDIFLTAMIFAGVLVQIMILLRLERMHKTLQAILVHTIKLPSDAARPPASLL